MGKLQFVVDLVDLASLGLLRGGCLTSLAGAATSVVVCHDLEDR